MFISLGAFLARISGHYLARNERCDRQWRLANLIFIYPVLARSSSQSPFEFRTSDKVSGATEKLAAKDREGECECERAAGVRGEEGRIAVLVGSTVPHKLPRLSLAHQNHCGRAEGTDGRTDDHRPVGRLLARRG